MSSPLKDKEVKQREGGEAVPIYLHAELLPNIRHVTLHISVPAKLQSIDDDDDDLFPNVSLSESRRAVSVSLPVPFGHVSETIKLPVRVSEASRHVLVVDKRNGRDTQVAGANRDNRREFSFRMQIDDGDESLHLPYDYMDTFVPWTAADMSPSTSLRCRQCEGLVLEKPDNNGQLEGNEDYDATRSTGWVWKDLPSGNWAEMMDFWHCHKPDPHEDEHGANGATQQLVEDANSKVKGYGASNQVLAILGTVLVDVATFLVSDIDCRGLKKVSQKNIDDSRVQPEAEIVCEKCGTLIGVEDRIARGWRLFKTSLSASFISTENDAKKERWETYPAELVVAAQLLELIERQSARRLVVHSGKNDGLLLWVFNPDMRYSNSSSHHSVTSQRAMKIFFQVTDNVEGMLSPEPGKTSSLSLEELRIPSSTLDSLSRTLEASNCMLPLSARTFREWKVGTLHRFERRRGCGKRGEIGLNCSTNYPNSAFILLMSTDIPEFCPTESTGESSDDTASWEHIEDTGPITGGQGTPPTAVDCLSEVFSSLQVGTTAACELQSLPLDNASFASQSSNSLTPEPSIMHTPSIRVTPPESSGHSDPGTRDSPIVL